MSDKITVIDPPPYKAWRVNFRSYPKGRRLIFSAVIDARDRHEVRDIISRHYYDMSILCNVSIVRELRPPSEWEKPL
jgi:hypothetical protein